MAPADQTGLVANLSEGERLRGGATDAADALLHQRHGEALVRNAVSGSALILRFVAGQMEVNPQQNILLFQIKRTGK